MTTDAFQNQMKAILGADYDAYIKKSVEPPQHGLRINRLKGTADEIKRGLSRIKLQPVPWCAEGFIYSSDERPAKSPAYHAGLFYIQEPSAMLSAVILNAKPGEKVLDLCAAPGGKSVQIAGQLQSGGLLVANDASASRCRALVHNLEMAGTTNAVVLSEQPNRLAVAFPGFFDRILVDAPCSGEGMFRRDVDAAKAWGENKPGTCARMQREILRHAAAMLKTGGRLVYSTCTFNTRENEEQIADFLADHKDFAAVPINHEALSLSSGLPPLPEAARIWPHLAPGEGHFVALLEKKGGDMPLISTTGELKSQKDFRAAQPLPRSTKSIFDYFCKDNLFMQISGNIIQHNQSLYKIPDDIPTLQGLRVARSGWYLGEIGKDRFTPSQALAMGIKREDARYFINLSLSEAEFYLKGNSFSPETNFSPEIPKPWVLVGYDRFPLGWARWMDGRLKNHLPVSWVMK